MCYSQFSTLTMRVWLSLPCARIFPWRFWFQYGSAAMPANVIYRAAHVMAKCDINSGRGFLCVFTGSFCNPVSVTSVPLSKYVTVSSSRQSIDKRSVYHKLKVDSAESLDHKSTDDKRAPQPLIEEIYSELMTAPKWLTADEWSAMGATKFSTDSFLSAKWPTLLLHFIVHKTNTVPGLYDVGMSLIDYVASLSDRHRLLRLVSAVAVSIFQGGEDHHEKALDLYDEISAEYAVMDHGSARILITALARTRYWHHCMELIDIEKIASVPSSKDYSPIIVAAVKNQDTNLANELLVTLTRSGLMPDDEVFLQMLASGTAEQTLAVLRNFAWICNRSVIESVITKLQSQPLGSNLIASETKIAKNGFCRQCGAVLECQPCITDEEFAELRQAFMNQSLIRDGNIFLQSSPQELSAFTQFLQQARSHPFTVVFDGLNIAYSNQLHTSDLRSRLLEEAISLFSRKGYRVLVFGRQHMKKWKVYRCCQNAHTGWFFTQNVSSDDPFILYAALYFGQGTYIVTNDELRDHSYVLGPELASRLKLWQRQRQITFTRNAVIEKFRFKWPNRYNTVVQQSANGWHVPFDDGSERSSYSLPDAWYCIQNKMSR